MTNTFWMVTVVVDEAYGMSTRQMMGHLDRQGIDTRPFLPPLSTLNAFAAYESAAVAKRTNSVAHDIAARAINLPSALMLDEAQVDRVCTEFRKLLDTDGERQ